MSLRAEEAEPPACLPLDLVAIDANRRAALAWLCDHHPAEEAVMDTVAAVYDLIAELEDLRERLSAFEGLPFRDEYSIHVPCDDGDGCDCGGTRAWCDADQLTGKAQRRGGIEETRRIYTAPWKPRHQPPA